jgi:RND family efflux transporter MFP subunit
MVLLALLLAACVKPSPQPPQAPEVTVARVQTKRIQDWDDFTGRLEAVESVEVRPRVSGYIDRVAFSEGSVVRRGDLLFEIDPRPYQADYDRAAAELVRMKTAQDLSGTELSRVQKLKDSGAVSQEEYDERKATLAQAEANVAGAKAALNSAALNLGFTKVISPIDGRVGRAEITRGNLVTGGSNGGTLLTTLVSIDPIYLYFDADEQAYLNYQQMDRAGTRRSSRDAKNPVQIGLANEPGWPHVGVMNFVDNQLNPATGTIRARAVLDNRDGSFTPGMFARVRLLGSGEYDATLIEDRAVGTDQSQKFVFVVNGENKVEYRPVKLGRLADGLRIVRDGLRPGENVIVNGVQRVRPGAVVNAKEEVPPAGPVAMAPASSN